MTIDELINKRAILKSLGGLDKIVATKDYYAALEEFLNDPICPECGTSGPVSKYLSGHIMPGIDGLKCKKCFHNGILVNLVHRKDLLDDDKMISALGKEIFMKRKEKSGKL